MALQLDIIIEKVNIAGSKPKNRLEQYRYFSLAGRAKNGNLLVKVRNKVTKKVRVVQYGHLVYSGHNPYNLTQERHEERVIHPKVKSFLKKLNLEIEQEVKISERSRVDFVCTNKLGRKIIIEVKSDKKRHCVNNLTEQISRYQTDGKKKYGNKFSKTYLVSMNGTYGFSLKELQKVLRQDNLI